MIEIGFSALEGLAHRFQATRLRHRQKALAPFQQLNGARAQCTAEPKLK
jgi:hypothetical protein